MAFRNIAGLILREVRYKEADRILTVLTAGEGKLTVKARGALRKSSRIAAATQQLTYAELTLFENKGKYTVNEAVIKEGFAGLRMEIEKFALGAYFAECLELYAMEGEPAEELLQLGLNSLYALSEGLAGRDKIKAAFEIRLACLSGYRPQLAACSCCGREEVEMPLLELDSGTVVCRGCRRPENGQTIPLSAASLQAMRYLTEAPTKKMLAFRLEPVDQGILSQAAERYFLRRSERSFRTLDYYRSF